MRLSIGRALFVVAVVGSALVADVAAGQVALTPTAIRPKPASHQVAPQHDRLKVATVEGNTQARQSEVGLPTTSSVSRPCTTNSGTQTRLGLLENSAVQSHCTGFTAP